MNKKITAVILSLILCLQLFSINTFAEKKMRGVWVSSVYNLDYPKKPTTSSEALKAEADNILDDCKALGFNAVFFQVRSASDAMYKSDIFPWSQWLTGSQGTAPDNDFDPLEYWVEGAHKRGMELHAWINPYRATKAQSGASLSALAISNPARQHPEYCVKYSDGNYYYDPAIPEVRDLVISGVREIIQNYDVDGIHMDDYFYPGTGFNDGASYAKYSRGFTNIDDWRRDNVNLLIKGISDEVRAANKNIVFGIAPSGIWANSSHNPNGSNTGGMESYYTLYADTRLWVKSEWIDYIAPQIYWEIGHSKADYATLTKWWANVCEGTNVKFYTGLADYRTVDAASSSAWYQGKALRQELDFNENTEGVDGEIHFRYRLLDNNVRNILKSYYSDTDFTLPEHNGTGENAVSNTNEESTEVQTVTQVETQVQTVTEQATETTTEFDPDGVYVKVNGEELVFDTKPIIENGRTLVPFRAIFEALGATVNWNNDVQQVTAQKGDTHVSLIIGDKNMLLNYKMLVALDVAPKIVDSRTLVPLRAISEALDAQVDWNNDLRLVTITTTDEQ